MIRRFHYDRQQCTSSGVSGEIFNLSTQLRHLPLLYKRCISAHNPAFLNILISWVIYYKLPSPATDDSGSKQDADEAVSKPEDFIYT